jgi:L-ascorbate metabolism protein UlaG (beta-lactamase superfamily)
VSIPDLEPSEHTRMIGRDVTVTWYGHGTWGWTSPAGVRVLVDPFLTGNPSTPEDMRRPEADLIVVTHGHGDHVGDVVEVAARTGAPVLAPSRSATGSRPRASRASSRSTRAAPWSSAASASR